MNEEQKRVTEYVKGALVYPLQFGQLTSMVILHFDISDKKAAEYTERALIDICLEWGKQVEQARDEAIKATTDAWDSYCTELLKQEREKVAQEIFNEMDKPCPHRDNDFPCPDTVPEELQILRRDCPDCMKQLRSRYIKDKQHDD